MLVDANLLLYSADTASRFHGRAREWLVEQLNGSHRIGLPWQSLGGFLRIATNPRVLPNPLPPPVAWRQVEIWLSALALEHGLAVCSADSDFARFDEVRWSNPLS